MQGATLARNQSFVRHIAQDGVAKDVLYRAGEARLLTPQDHLALAKLFEHVPDLVVIEPRLAAQMDGRSIPEDAAHDRHALQELLQGKRERIQSRLQYSGERGRDADAGKS